MDRDAIGYALTLSGTFLAALGYVLQKAAHNSHESAHGRAGPLSHSPTWLAGLVCMVASAGLVVAASPFLDQSKSAPLGAATLVFNMVLATLLLKERFTVVAAVSTAVIVGGVVIAVSSSEAASTNFTFGDILRLARDPLVAVYACAAAAGMGGAAWWLVRLDARPERVWSAREKAAFVLAAPLLGGWCNGFVSYAAKVLTTVVVGGELAAAASGAAGGGALWLFVALVTLAVVGQVSFLNKGLAHASALAVVPVFQASIIVSNSIAGIIFFGDLRSGSAPWRMAVFFLGAAVCTAGVALLRVQRPPPPAPPGGGAPGDVSPAAAAPEWGVKAGVTAVVAAPAALAGGAAPPAAAGAPAARETERESAPLAPARAASARGAAATRGGGLLGGGADAPTTWVDWLNLDVSEAIRRARA